MDTPIILGTTFENTVVLYFSSLGNRPQFKIQRLTPYRHNIDFDMT
jgi:hypothetical protein